MRDLCLPASKRDICDETGASLFELLVVVAIITILATVSIFYFAGHSRLFKPDEESLKLVDLLQEARQRSLTQRETMRVEIDITANMARLIDEHTASTETDDTKIREMTLYPATDIKLDSQPPDISTYPPDALAAQSANFQLSVYPASVTHRVLTLRFMKDGTIYNAGTSPTGNNSTIAGGTLFIWAMKPNTTNQSDFDRAITFIGTTGSIKLWEYNRALTTTNKWQDSRRTGVYGQSGNSNSN